MCTKFAFRIVILAICAISFTVRGVRAQEHVRLMPQVRNGGIMRVAFSPDGRLALTGSNDGTARLWDVATGQQIRILGPPTQDKLPIQTENSQKALTSVAFSPNGRSVLTGGDDGTARLWDVATGQQIRAFEEKLGVDSVAFSPDGRLVLTGGLSRADIWDVATGQQLHTLEGHLGSVDSVAFSPDGRLVLTGDGTARLWNAATGQQIRSFEGYRGGGYGIYAAHSAAFSPNGRFVVTDSSFDHTARLWDVATGQQIRSFEGHAADIRSVAFSPDGRFVLTGSDDSTARLWDTSTAQQVHSFEGHSSLVSSAVFSPDGRFVLTGSRDQTARLWDVATGQQIRSFEGHTTYIWSVAFSPDGRSVLSGGEDGTARLWDLASGQQIRSFEGHAGEIRSVAFSPDGRSVLTGGRDGTARLWDVPTGRLIREFKGHTSDIADDMWSVTFSPDGRYILTECENLMTARLWDETTGQLVRSFEHTGGESVAFSPDGRSVLTGGVRPPSLWDVATGQTIRTFEGHTGNVTSVTFSPDGRFILTGSMDETARLWDEATGQQIRSFEGHDGKVYSVAFSPDGSFVLTGSEDTTTRLWEVATGQQIRSFKGHTGPVDSVAFSPDGRFVLTGSEDTTARLWEAATGRHLATMLSFDENGWAVIDPEGRYDSDAPDNTQGLAWSTDSNRIIELKQLKDNYYTPNLLASIIKGERLPNVNGLDRVPAPPEVAIASLDRAGNRRIALTIENQGGGVGRLVVSVNDREVAALDKSLAAKATDKTGHGRVAHVTVDLSSASLRPGENTVTAYAFDSTNQIRSHYASATFIIPLGGKGVRTAPETATFTNYKPQFYGIVVGTGTFGNHSMDLLYPAHDAESMMIALEIGANHLFGPENVHLYLLKTNEKEESVQPTKRNIVAAFADVMKNAKPTDVMLVYLSGHGVNLRGQKDSYYYLTADAKSLDFETNPALKQQSTVSGTELRQWLGAKNMPLKEVLILDTCAAGAANPELMRLVDKRDVPPDQRRAVEFLKEATGTIILMGSAADKVSYEASKYSQGLLTYALLNGMKGRSVDASSQLNVGRWFQNASEDVLLLARSIGGIQKPVIAAPNGMGFPVALLDTNDEAKIPLAAAKHELVHLSCHNENDQDPLELGAAVRENLREISRPSTRGQAEPAVVYLDDIMDGPIDWFVPKVVYSVQGNTVNLRLRIDQANKTLREEQLTLSYADKTALATAIAVKLVTLASQVPLQSVRQ